MAIPFPQQRLLRRLVGLLVLLGFALFAGACDGDGDAVVVRLKSGPMATVPADPGEDEPPIRFAIAGVLGPERSALLYARFSGALAGALRRHVEIVRRRTYAELNELLRVGWVDAGILCPGAFAIGREQFGLRAVLTPTVGDKASHRALVVVRRDGPRKSLDDLRGAVLASNDPLSASGYLYLASALQARGERVDAFFGRILFTYSHDNTIQAVRDGIADAGAVHSQVWDAMVRETPRLADTLLVIDESPDLPGNVVVVSPRAAPELADELGRALLSMPSTELGGEVLKDFGITGFVRLPDAAYDPLVQSWRALGALPTPGGQP